MTRSRDCRCRYLKLVGVLACVASTAVVPAAELSINGRVLDKAAGEPISDAAVALKSVADGVLVRQVWTDDTGKFVFRHVTAGEYAIEVRKQGYFIDRLASSRSHLLTVQQGEKYDGLIFRLFQGGTITGVVGPASGGLQRAWVFALQQRTLHPSSAFRIAASSEADEQGRYRLAGLFPGLYKLVVAPRPFAPGSHGFPPIYCPGEPALDRARAIMVGAGEVVAGADVLLPATASVYRVRGTVREVNARRCVVSLYVPDFPIAFASIVTDAEGAFSFDSVPLGEYDVVAVAPVAAFRSSTLLVHGTPRVARESVTVAGSDVAGIALQLQRPVPVIGKVRLEDAEAECSQSVSLILEALDPVPLEAPRGRLDRTGALKISVMPGFRYRPVIGTRTGCFLKDVRVSGGTFVNGILTCDHQCQVTMVLTSSTGSIKGSVLAQDNPPTIHLVALASSSEGSPFELVRTVATDGEARYYAENLGPGHYSVIAIPRSDAEKLSDLSFWLRHFRHVVETKIEAGKITQANLTLAEPESER